MFQRSYQSVGGTRAGALVLFHAKTVLSFSMSIEKLTDDCLELVFIHCGACPLNRCILSQVCRRWHVIARRQSVVSFTRIPANVVSTQSYKSGVP